MTTEQKAQIARQACQDMRADCESRGNEHEARLFWDIQGCSDRGLAALYDALTAS